MYKSRLGFDVTSSRRSVKSRDVFEFDIFLFYRDLVREVPGLQG